MYGKIVEEDEGAMAKPVAYVTWDEVPISNEKGRREVHFYLIRSSEFGGGRDLAVVGKEKTLRHMSYSMQSSFLRRNNVFPSLKLRSRREVMDFLKSFAPTTTDSLPYGSSPVYRLLDDDGDDDDFSLDVPSYKHLSSRKARSPFIEFSWIGSPSICRKRRKHYQSFYRNGVIISVHDFVYVMAEENKRLVAYLEDLYEDSRANNMVSVRWFHQIDEVGIVLPPDFNDREIFFSLCLQDLSVECIDGIAAVLSPQHFDKFLNEASSTLWEPYLCCRQFDNDDIKPFDITQIQGYWNQELLRYMYTYSSRRDLKLTSGGISLEGDGHADAMGIRSKKKHGSTNRDTGQDHKMVAGEASNHLVNSKISGPCNAAENNVPNDSPATSLPRRLVIKQKLSVGGCVEVLSQDSGIRGCWFRGVILKRHQDKVKIRYQDLLDADETRNLEEWVLASRVSVPDELGFRLHGRTTVRPCPPSKEKDLLGFNVGTAVDAWWHDGWWEGVVIRKESEDKIHVYFPGERQTSVFDQSNLRSSQDWVCSRWNHIRERPDLVRSLLSDQERTSRGSSDSFEALASDGKDSHVDSILPKGKIAVACRGSSHDAPPLVEKNVKVEEVPKNLHDDYSFAHLKWNSSSKKRRQSRENLGKGGLDFKRRYHCSGSSSSSSSYEDIKTPACGDVFSISSMKIDGENCKFVGDHLFAASIPPLPSWVLSR